MFVLLLSLDRLRRKARKAPKPAKNPAIAAAGMPMLRITLAEVDVLFEEDDGDDDEAMADVAVVAVLVVLVLVADDPSDDEDEEVMLK